MESPPEVRHPLVFQGCAILQVFAHHDRMQKTSRFSFGITAQLVLN
jgi:hypothetical protein